MLLAEAERRWGRGALVRWGDAADSAKVEAISTGFVELDEALGVGGLPCGRISEIFGPDSSGKQALAASLAVQCQKAEGVVAWIDPARRLAPEQMNVQGVEFDSLLVARPENELQALEMAIRLARSGGVKLLVFDLAGAYQLSGRDALTLTLSQRKRELAQNSELRTQNSEPSPHHSSLNLALRRLVAAVDRNQIAFVFISDISHPPSSTPDPVLSTHRSTGGQALRYFASVRLEMERREWIRAGREVVGCRSAVRVVKNKLAPPLREAEVSLQFYRFPGVLP
ncbi:MAG: DNA recombination/repair protein RecA [Actinobacteria bacterium]|nr:DNA recombination/repair protein RecA [Actinomycetota bacterium]